MSGNEVGGSPEPDDSPWRPDADVVFDHPPRRNFDEDDRTAGGAPPTGSWLHRRPLGSTTHRWLAVVGVVAAVGVGAFWMSARGSGADPVGEVSAAAGGSSGASRAVKRVDLGGDVTIGPDQAPLPSGPSECLTDRLPQTIDPVWEAVVPGARRVLAPVSVGDSSLVGLAELDAPASSTGSTAVLFARDLADGDERWTAELQPATGSHEIVGIADGAVVVRSVAGPDMAYRRLLAFDESSGDLLWGEGFDGDWSVTVVDDVVVVETRAPGTPIGEVVALAPRTADAIARVAGSFLGVDTRGRLLTRAGDKVLAGGSGDVGGTVADSEVVGLVEPGTLPFTVAGDRVVVGQRNGSALSVFGPEPSSTELPVGRRVPLIGSPRLERPGFVIGLDPLGGSAILVTGGGGVHGAELTGDSVEVRWRARGITLASAPTDRGRAVLVATSGGANQRVLDGSTGRTIADIDLRPGALTTLGLFANGVVVQRSVDGELVRSAVDLDGRELWRLPGTGPIAVDDGVVVDVDDDPASRSGASDVRIVTYAGPAECAG